MEYIQNYLKIPHLFQYIMPISNFPPKPEIIFLLQKKLHCQYLRLFLGVSCTPAGSPDLHFHDTYTP